MLQMLTASSTSPTSSGATETLGRQLGQYWGLELLSSSKMMMQMLCTPDAIEGRNISRPFVVVVVAYLHAVLAVLLIYCVHYY